MTTLYGISNCDTVKKARTWLDKAGVLYRFHDFRVDGLEEPLARRWIETLGWQAVLNKRSTTWRGLDDDVKIAMDEAIALREILVAPTLIKRPVLEEKDSLFVGFDQQQYKNLFEA